MPYKDPLLRAQSVRKRVRAYAQRIRVRTLMFFGGKCEHCGINDSRVLQLDHKSGGGYRQRIRTGKQGQIYREGTHMIGKDAMGRPDDFQILCANCNWIKRHERGETGGNKAYVAVEGGA